MIVVILDPVSSSTNQSHHAKSADINDCHCLNQRVIFKYVIYSQL